MVTYKLFILMLKEIIGKVYPEHWATKVDHIAKCGITKPHSNNNKVERLNGTQRTCQSTTWMEKLINLLLQKCKESIIIS